MSFAAAAQDDGPRSDRLLMISMLGIVVMTAIAFGVSLINRKNLPSVQPAAPQAIPAPAPSPAPADPKVATPQPDPMPPPPQNPIVQSDPPPMQPDPVVVYQPPTPEPQPQLYSGERRNPKVSFVRDVTEIH